MKSLLKLTFILSIVIAFNLNTFGQQQFGIKVSGGLSRITESIELSNATLTTLFVPSGQGGLYYNLSLGKKSSLGAELLFSQIEGKNVMEMDLIDIEGNKIGHVTDIAFRHISYLSLPVYYGFKIKRLTINGGFQISYALASSGREKNDATINEINEESYSYNRKTDDINISNLDFGPRAGIIYHLTNKLAVEGTYYYGINNISKSNPLNWELKVQQMTFGIRYALWYKKLRNEKPSKTFISTCNLYCF